MSESKKGCAPTKGNTGNKHSEESKKKMSETIKKKNQQIHKCPHCLSEGIGTRFKGWHFNNCKVLKLNMI